MSTIEPENRDGKPAAELPQPRRARKPAKKIKPGKKASHAKKPASRPLADGSNKKADVIAFDEARQRRNVG